jgi:hypothetical protein
VGVGLCAFFLRVLEGAEEGGEVHVFEGGLEAGDAFAGLDVCVCWYGGGGGGVLVVSGRRGGGEVNQ